jgi:hypothetical protein
MKKHFLSSLRGFSFPAVVFAALFLAWNTQSCKNEEEVWDYYGDTITLEDAVEVTTLPELMKGKQLLEAKLSGTIQECCQKKGCWMKLELGNGQMLRVGFKDYAFFMPLDAAGSKVIMQGIATYDTTTVEALRHYAEDAGKTKDEIAAITEPEIELVFEASGVRLKK